jgi:hypothetical protein
LEEVFNKMNVKFEYDNKRYIHVSCVDWRLKKYIHETGSSKMSFEDLKNISEIIEKYK